jgi:hypothetical protein
MDYDKLPLPGIEMIGYSSAVKEGIVSQSVTASWSIEIMKGNK